MCVLQSSVQQQLLCLQVSAVRPCSVQGGAAAEPVQIVTGGGWEGGVRAGLLAWQSGVNTGLS